MFQITGAVMDATRCRLIQQWGSGLEGVDLAAARARGIWVANVPAPGSNADSVAEHTMLLILALLRRLPEAVANVRRGVLGTPPGLMLAGRTVCLYGLGHDGAFVGETASALRCSPRWHHAEPCGAESRGVRPRSLLRVRRAGRVPVADRRARAVQSVVRRDARDDRCARAGGTQDGSDSRERRPRAAHRLRGVVRRGYPPAASPARRSTCSGRSRSRQTTVCSLCRTSSPRLTSPA